MSEGTELVKKVETPEEAERRREAQRNRTAKSRWKAKLAVGQPGFWEYLDHLMPKKQSEELDAYVNCGRVAKSC